MRVSIDNTRWWETPLAALIFFTHLPFWRIAQPDKSCYRRVVEYWPLAGWLTGGIMAATLYGASMLFPYPIAVVIAIAMRLLVTGALHEDGLCDFFDGFGGGGNDRQRILDIMKDSRIGTYGVIGLLVYVLLLYFSLSYMPVRMAAFVIIAADPFAKMVAGQIIMMMPYARTEEESKAKVVYRNINIRAGIGLAVQGMLPCALLTYMFPSFVLVNWQWIVFAPCLVMYFLYLMIWRKLRGYTGDCCGALFLLIELTFYMTVVVLLYMNQNIDIPWK